MSGFNLLDKYGINEEDIPENVGRRTVAAGVYPYTITDVNQYVNEEKGSESIYIDYDFGDDGNHREWFTTQAEDDEWVRSGLSNLRKRLAFFGQSLTDFRPDGIIGRTGTLEIQLGKRKGSPYIAEFSVDEEGAEAGAEAEESEEAPMALAKKPAAKAAAKTRGGNNPFGK